VDGIEWLNADSEWRDESRATLGRAVLQYLVRPAGALATLLDRPATLDRWERLSRTRPIVALAAADAHGGIRRRGEETGAVLGRIGIPSYEAAFGTFSNSVVLPAPLSGDAAADADAIFRALRQGQVFSTIDAAAGPGLLDFRMDGSTIVARTPAPGAELALYGAGRELQRSTGESRWESGGAPGPYRVEVRLPGLPGTPPVPWLVSNQIFAGPIEPPPADDSIIVPSGSRIAPFPWRFEKDDSSSAIVRTRPYEAELEFRLGSEEGRSPFVALATDIERAAFSAIDLELAANQPMRVSVQVREGERGRWGTSMYVDPAGSARRITLSRMRRLAGPVEEISDSRQLTSILLVVDLTNAAPGQRGRLRVLNSALVNY
jgi:hypothetical protein